MSTPRVADYPVGAIIRPLFGGYAMSRFTKMAFFFSSITMCGAIPLFAQSDLNQRVAREMDSLVATYKRLHENPDLSTEEKDSSALIPPELRKLAYDVP